MAAALPREEIPTVSSSVDRLTKAGYADWFKADKGRLRSALGGCTHPPDEMQVDEYLRFEGETNPDDEAIVFALTCKVHGVKGTYTVPYGSDTPPGDVEVVRQLRLEAAKGK
jgi:hypothetical protein